MLSCVGDEGSPAKTKVVDTMTIAIRFSGPLEITICYSDELDGYDVEVADASADDRCSVKLEGIRLSPHHARRLAVDSDEAFDRIAQAALAFADHEDPTVGELAEHDEREGFRVSRGSCDAAITFYPNATRG